MPALQTVSEYKKHYITRARAVTFDSAVHNSQCSPSQGRALASAGIYIAAGNHWGMPRATGQSQLDHLTLQCRMLHEDETQHALSDKYSEG